MNFKCIIFDLDGTLVNTLGDISAATNHALAGAGFPVLPRERYAEIAGQGLRKLISLALPPAAVDEKTVDTLFHNTLVYYRTHPADYSEPYPGIPELIAELRNKRIKTAVLSNKADVLSQMVIGKFFPLGSFNIIRGEMPNFPRKPDPTSTWEIITELDSSPRETLFVGDSEVDVETAHAAECSILGVSWGFRGKKSLEAAGADRIIDTPEEMLDLLSIRY
jgi:phosphoglycolate phosphatase